MEIKESINYVKSKIYTEVGDFERKKKECDNFIGKKDVLKEILDLFSSIDNIMDNHFLLGLELPIVYGDDEGNRIYDLIMDEVYALKSNSVSEFYSGSFSQQLNNIVEKLKSDYENYKNRIELLKTEIFRKEPTVIVFRRILSNFKYNSLLTSYQISLIGKIMKKYKMSNEDQIRVYEVIRIHNTK